MLHDEFGTRLHAMCNTLGFHDLKISQLGNCNIDGFSDLVQRCRTEDGVLVLSCKVHYNPNWGGFCGHPQLLTPVRVDRNESCPAGFLAPFLQQYHYAEERIFLTKTKGGRYLITLPQGLLVEDEKKNGIQLRIALEKVAEPDKDGGIVAASTVGTRVCYTLSSSLRRDLEAQNYPWKTGRSMPIGRYLTSKMFSFTRVDLAIDTNNPFYTTLCPHIGELVTHKTPNLRAAQIHLQHEFQRVISQLTAQKQTASANLLCLVGLDIDMTPFTGHNEQYFVPWQAYLTRKNGLSDETCSLNQDDLFGQLLQ